MTTWLNEWEVNEAYRRWHQDLVLGPATVTLANLVDAVNRCSDGWPYWQKPARASAKLQDLITRADRERRSTGEHTVTAAEVRKAITPIRSFVTRHPEVKCQIVAPLPAGRR